jgi:hypothetical protein
MSAAVTGQLAMNALDNSLEVLSGRMSHGRLKVTSSLGLLELFFEPFGFLHTVDTVN